MRRGHPFVSAPFKPPAGVLALGILVAASPLGAVPALACDPTFEFACQVGQTIGKDARDAGHAIATGAHEAGATIAKTAHEFGTAVGNSAHEVGAAVGKGARNVRDAFRNGTQGQGVEASQPAPARAPGPASPATP